MSKKSNKVCLGGIYRDIRDGELVVVIDIDEKNIAEYFNIELGNTELKRIFGTKRKVDSEHFLMYWKPI